MTWAERDLAAYLGAAGRLNEARAAVKRLLASHPEANMKRVEAAPPFMSEGPRRRYFDGLRKAGLPD